MGAQGGPGRVLGEVVDDAVGAGVQRGEGVRAEVVFGGDVQGVGVPGGRVGQAGGGVGLVAQQGGGGDGGVVAGEDLLQEVGGGVGVQVLAAG